MRIGLLLVVLAAAGCRRGLPTEADARRALEGLRSYDEPARWSARAQAVRAGIRRGAHLDVLDPSSPLNPSFRRPHRVANHLVEAVSFEAIPGFLVTGNLYRPLDTGARGPAILLPHGHFREAGYQARTRPTIQIAAGTLAEMGATVFAYDMVGWGDSRQLPHQTPSVLALQLWSSLRGVDFLLSLPGTDPARVGIAGASGGGSQALLAAAIDERIAATAVVVMLSAAFPGGDVCENGMPVRASTGSNNAEIAATLAPRPLLIVSDGTDWTRTVPNVEYPYLQRVYAMLGTPAAVQNVHLPAERHDDGPSKRQALYRFFAGAFGLTLLDGEVSAVEPHAALTVFGEEGEQPARFTPPAGL